MSLKPSALYRSELWRIGLSAARVLPRFLLENTAVLLASSYHATQRRRRTIVTQNLLPPLAFDAAAARAQTRALFRQFGLKLADLWRYEAGCAIDDPIVDPDAWKHFDAGLTQKRGLLLVTPHIGNWELGAPFLRKKRYRTAGDHPGRTAGLVDGVA